MVTARKVAVPEIMLKMVRRVYAVAAVEKRKLSRYIRGTTAQPYSKSNNNTSIRWLSSRKALIPKAWNTTWKKYTHICIQQIHKTLYWNQSICLIILSEYCSSNRCHTDQHEETRQQEVDQVPKQGWKPEVCQVDAADLLHMLGLDGGLCYKQQGKSAGQGGHPIHQVDSNGKPCLTPT